MVNILARIILLCFLPAVTWAQNNGGGLGGVALNLMEPVTFFSDFVQTGCIVIGGAFLFASVIKYFEHKRSPLMVPMSTVVFLVVAGCVLLLLPLITYLTENGVPYFLLRR